MKQRKAVIVLKFLREHLPIRKELHAIINFLNVYFPVATLNINPAGQCSVVIVICGAPKDL